MRVVGTIFYGWGLNHIALRTFNNWIDSFGWAVTGTNAPAPTSMKSKP